MKTFLSTVLIMFFIMDPLGNVPIFLSVLKGVKPERRRSILIRELVISLIVLLIFFFVGKYVMSLLHLTQESISISGGLILLIIALKMIFPQKQELSEQSNEEPFIVPLAIPLIAGPSVFAVILLLPQTPVMTLILNLCAMLTAWGISSVILACSTNLYKILKVRGLLAMEKLMGMLLVILATQMLIDGLKMVIHAGKV